MRIEHPRAARGQTPPDRVGVAQRTHANVDDEGYFEVEDRRAEAVMQSFAERYGVEFTDDGDVVLPEEDVDEDAGEAEEAEPADETEEATEADEADEATAEADGADEADEFDLEAFLDQKYTERADAVAAGEVDAHLDELASAETSTTVEDAIEARREELEE